MINWISVKDRLPDKDRWVLALSKEWDEPVELWFNDKGQFIRNGDCCSSDEVITSVEYWFQYDLIPLPKGWK